MTAKPRHLVVLMLTACLSGVIHAAENPSPKLTLISNVNIFDGQSDLP